MKTTFGQTFVTVAVILLAALLLVGISFQVLVKNFLTEKTQKELENDAKVVAQLTQAYYSGQTLPSKDFHVALTVATAASNFDAVICDVHGRLVLCANEPYGCEHVGMMLAQDYLTRSLEEGGSTDTGVIEGLYPDKRYVVSRPIQSSLGKTVGLVIVSAPMDNTTQVISRITRMFVFVSILVVAVAVVLMIVFVRRQSTPLRDMARAASAFGHGEFTSRVDVGSGYSQEVEELALAFNNMASSLEKSEYQRQEFVANVSHELKTPMTTISGYVDGILDGTIPKERQNQYLRLVSEETKRLSRLVRSMLDISRLREQGRIPEDQTSRFDLAECAGQVLISFEQKIMAKNLQVQVDMPEHPVYTVACQDHITQVIYNLVDNGVKFCPEGGRLGLCIQEGGAKAYISVINDGQTIPPEELPFVFDRFHKLDKSRSQNRDSWGLGLYIVKTIVDLHGENISVTSVEGKTTFTFTLPLVL